MQISSQQRKVRSFWLPYQETKSDPHLHFVDESQRWHTRLFFFFLKKKSTCFSSVKLTGQHIFIYHQIKQLTSPQFATLNPGITSEAASLPSFPGKNAHLLIACFTTMISNCQTPILLQTRENCWSYFFFLKAYFNTYSAQASFVLFQSL